MALQIPNCKFTVAVGTNPDALDLEAKATKRGRKVIQQRRKDVTDWKKAHPGAQPTYDDIPGDALFDEGPQTRPAPCGYPTTTDLKTFKKMQKDGLFQKFKGVHTMNFVVMMDKPDEIRFLDWTVCQQQSSKLRNEANTKKDVKKCAKAKDYAITGHTSLLTQAEYETSWHSPIVKYSGSFHVKNGRIIYLINDTGHFVAAAFWIKPFGKHWGLGDVETKGIGGIKALIAKNDMLYRSYGAFDDDYYAYGGGLNDYYYHVPSNGYNRRYKTSAKLGAYGDKSGRYKREGGAAASFMDFDNYYYDDSDAASAYQGRLDDYYYHDIFGDEYSDDMDGYYDYDGGYKASEKLSVYADSNYYDPDARLGRYYGSKLKAKQGRNHRNRYGRRGLMDYMEHGEMSGDPAGLILSVILFIGFIAVFVVIYRYKMRKKALDERHYGKDEDQV